MVPKIEYLEDEDIVSVWVSGPYKLDEQLGTVLKAFTVLEEHNCNKCLFDLRDATLVLDTLSIFNRSKEYDALGFGRSIKLVALVNETSDNSEFYENVSVSRGWNVKVFIDFDAAIDWLNE